VEAPPRRRTLLPKLALSLGTFVVLLLGVEGAARVRQWARYGTFGAIHEFAVDPDTGLAIPPPGRVTETMTINSLGFRGPELEASAEGVRIAFLGASTTFCAEASSDAATWPSLVCDRLRERFPGASFDYVNAGVAGYTMAQTRLGLAHRVAPTEPDVIVIYHATNDLTRNSREEARRQGVYRGHADQSSWLADWSLAWYLVGKNLLLRTREQAARSGEGRLEVDAEALAAPFRDELRALVDEARERAELVALATFSHRARPEQTPEERFEACSTSLYYMPYMTPDGLLESFAAYNRVIREVAREKGVLLLECAEAIPGDGVHFNDSVHFTDAGCAAMAECVAAGLAAAPELAAHAE
jgi:lysophospholipase L1-like esterase